MCNGVGGSEAMWAHIVVDTICPGPQGETEIARWKRCMVVDTEFSKLGRSVRKADCFLLQKSETLCLCTCDTRSLTRNRWGTKGAGKFTDTTHLFLNSELSQPPSECLTFSHTNHWTQNWKGSSLISIICLLLMTKLTELFQSVI